MGNITAIIVDDEQDGIDVLELMLKNIDAPVDVVSTCTSAERAVKCIRNYKPDLVFLDIEMPGKNGFDVLNAFPDASFKLIVVTGYDQYAVKAIKYMAMDYLLKPFDEDELKDAIDKVGAALDRSDNRLTHFREFMSNDQGDHSKIIISSSSGFHVIHFDKIVSIESRPGNYSLIRLYDGVEHIATKPLSHFEDLLPFPLFYRIHRSSIINLEAVEGYNNKSGAIRLSNGEQLEVSVRRRKEFSSYFRR